MTPDQLLVIERAAAVPERLADAARAAPPEPPAPGEWPPTDVLRHLIAVEEEVWNVRLRQLIAEDEPHWAWAEPDRWQGAPDASLDELLVAFAERRATTIALLTELDDEGWAKTGVHATFGRLDAAGLMQKALDHDDEHIASFAVGR
jgi:DinB superfamily